MRAVAVSMLLALAVGLFGAACARAVLVQLPDGHVVGVTPPAGVAPASIRGARRSVQPNVTDTGTVSYHGGPVVRSSAPYLILWGPPGSFPASTEGLMTHYFADVAGDHGLASNVYSVLRQYSDTTGISDYQQAFSGAQVITDTFGYPPQVNCTDHAPTDETNCINDAQLEHELTRVIAQNGLPTDGPTNAGALVAGAPIYFILTPAHVNVCTQASQCADNDFCAYHGSYADGTNNVLYASIPLINALVTDPAQGLDPKSCQADGHTAVQEPNLDGGDVAINYMSHENSETITDPLGGSGWSDPISGNEVGDNCHAAGSVNPAAGDSPNAFLPTLGGSPAAGTLFDQLINVVDQYYTQSEWSNGTIDCRMQPPTTTLAATFAPPSGIAAVGRPAILDPTASSSAAGYSSIGWSFGDGATSFISTATTSSPAPAAVSHIYAAAGTYAVTLTVVDGGGNLASATRTVTVRDPPSAAFTATPADPAVGTPVSFDGSASPDPNPGASISSYSWSFGDGGAGTGVTVSHAYTAAGAYLVTLTVTDSLGLSSSVSNQIDVVAPPTATFTSSPGAPAPPGPTASRASLTGIAKNKPKLSLVLTAGSQGSSIEKIVIGLPGGLSFSRRGLAKGLSIRAPSGQKLVFTATLSHGKLTVALKRAAGAVKLTIARPAITVSGKLERGVRSGKIRTVPVAVTVLDSAGGRTSLTVVVGVKH